MNLLLRCICCSLALTSLPAWAQSPAERILVVSPAVGELIDGTEKARFGLFPTYSADEFQEARFVQALTADSTITLRARLRGGREVELPYSKAEYAAVQTNIARRAEELGLSVGAPGVAPSAPPTAAGRSTPEIVGRTYSVELRSGSSFTGILRAASPLELEFETKDLGVVRVQRSNVSSFLLLNAEQTRRGYDDVGNGTRMFFAPTARNLRKGEGYVQSIDIFLIGANYGITDNFSVGALVPVLPGLGLTVFAITPKLSAPINDKFSAGLGVLYINALGSGGGIGYGNATYGTADNNVTLGLGYGFGGGDVGSTPVVVVGGNLRVARRLSLVTETYIISGGAGGLFGARVAASRVSGSLGMLYLSGNEIGGVYPAYAEFAYRFGKTFGKTK